MYTLEKQHQRNRLCVNLSTLFLIFILLFSHINYSICKTITYYFFNIYIYIYVYIYVCIYIYMYVYVYIYIYIYIFKAVINIMCDFLKKIIKNTYFCWADISHPFRNQSYIYIYIYSLFKLGYKPQVVSLYHLGLYTPKLRKNIKKPKFIAS